MFWAHYGWLIGITVGALAVGEMVHLLTLIERDLTDIHALLWKQFPEQQLQEDALRDRITPYIKRNQKITAIKIVRQTMGCTLIEAKRFVDEWAAEIS